MEAFVIRVYALKCPSCGASLGVSESLGNFACAYCGASIQLERGDGTVSLHLLTDAITSIQRSSERTAAELAIKRLHEELAELELGLASAIASRPVMPRADVVSALEAQEHSLRNQIETTNSELAKQLRIVAK